MKVGLILEGGAMRGMYTCGVIDTLLDNNINVDGIIGVSAGALFGVNYFSNQRGRAIRYSKKYCKDKRYISVLSYLLTGNVVNKKFAYYKVSEKLDPFDNETFIKNNKDFTLVTTNINTGEAEYIKITNPLKQMEYLRATSAIPLYTKIVKIDNKEYLDGAIADSIPYKYLKKQGYDKIIIVLTRDINFRKEQLSDKDIIKINKKYSKYPKFIDAMIKRPSIYNDTLDLIKKDEEKGKIFVIRPSDKIDINIIERDKNKLDSVYNMGIKDANKYLKSLKEYLKK